MKHTLSMDSCSAAAVGMLLCTHDGAICSANPALEALLGYSQDELRRLNIIDLIHPDDRIPYQEANHRLFADGQTCSSYRMEQRLVSKRGKLIWCITLAAHYRDEGTDQTYVVMQFVENGHLYDDSSLHFFSAMEQVNDITAQATDVGEMLDAVLDSMLDIFSSDRAWLLYPCDPQAPSFCVERERTRPQWPGAMSIGQPVPLSPDTRDTLAMALAEGKPIRYDGVDGREAPESVAASFGVKAQMCQAIHPRTGKPWLLGIHHCESQQVYTLEDQRLFDGIGRRIADALSNLLLLEELRESERKHRQLFETMEKGVFYLDSKGQVLSANSSAARILGLSNEQVLAHGLAKLRDGAIYEDGTPCPEDALPDTLALKMGRPVRNKVIGTPTNSSGEYRWLLINAIPQCNQESDQVDHIYFTFTDITQRRLADSEMRKLSQVVEQSPASVVITDLKGNITYVNTKFEQISGYPREEAIGENPRLLKSGATSDDEYERLWQTITTGGEWRGELHNKRKDGTLYWERATISPIKDKDGHITNFLGIKEDISEQKLVEQALHRSQKMDAIGQITGGIAHDFNNLLGIIIGNLDFLERLLKKDEASLRHIQTANKAALRAADVTRQLLGFSRQQAQNIIATNINQFIRGMEGLIARSVTPEVEIEFLLNPDLWQTRIDQGDFEVSLLNLIINARDAMPEGGRLTIQTANTVLDQAHANQNSIIPPGDYVELKVTDTGSGISEADMEHIFEPFFSTKPQGKGTGLGMSTVFGFCKRSAGMANVYSELGVGTSIVLYLPRAQDTTNGQTQSEDKIIEPPKGTETILVVDDEEDLAMLAQIHLEDLGYQTLTACTSKDALALIEQHDNITLLFSDVVMPGGMSGFELAERAVELRPALKVLLTSGFTKEAPQGEDSQRHAKALLRKPYRKAELASHIRAALDQ